MNPILARYAFSPGLPVLIGYRICEGAPVLVEAMSLERDWFSEHKLKGGLLDSLPLGLTIFRTVDAAKTDTFRVVVVQDFEGVAVEDAYYLADEVGSLSDGRPTEK